MPKRIPLQLGLQQGQSRHPPAGAVSLINMTAEPLPAEEQTDACTSVLIPVHGVTQFRDMTGNVVGLHSMRDSLYVVTDNGLLWRISKPDGTNVVTANVGSGINNPGNFVQMTDNGQQLTICNVNDSGNVWVHEYGSTSVSLVTDVDFPGARWVENFDQFTVYGHYDGTGFGISALADSTSYDALDVASAEAIPDDIIMGIRDHRQLILFGSLSIEFWYNSGASDFPFERTGSGVLEVGCAAARSVVKLDTCTYFLGRSRGGLSVGRIVGNSVQRVSTPTIDAALDGYAYVTDAIGMAYTFAGHSYYVLTLPSIAVTIVYDVTTGAWHKRKSIASVNGDKWQFEFMESWDGKVLFASSGSGIIGYANLSATTELGEAVNWETITQPVSYQGKQVTFSRLELLIDAGRTTNPYDAEPTIDMSWSDDDGRSWSDARSRTTGGVAEYKTRLIWTNLGSSRKRRFKFTGTATVPVALMGAYLDIEVGP